MNRISLSAQTLYAELAQRLDFGGPTPASVVTRVRKGRAYLYAFEKHGERWIETYIGPADDAGANDRAEILRRARDDSNQRRELVQMIKRAGVAGPIKQAGQILEALDRAGYFDNGLIVVGTIAFQIYPIIVGRHLANAGMMTNDADFAIASIIDIKGDADLTTVLQRGDATIRSQNQLSKSAAPKRFRAANGFEVEILTPVRTRADRDSVAVKNIGASATPLHYLEFLIKDAISAVALHGAGVSVKIPQPERFAVHKLIIAAQSERDRTKRRKDLIQAQELIDALIADDSTRLAASFAEAISRGPKWIDAIAQSLIDIKAQETILDLLPAAARTRLEKRSVRPAAPAPLKPPARKTRAVKAAKSR